MDLVDIGAVFDTFKPDGKGKAPKRYCIFFHQDVWQVVIFFFSQVYTVDFILNTFHT